jgi:hypothetical protein
MFCKSCSKLGGSFEFLLPLHMHSSHGINSYAKVDKIIEGQQCISVCDNSTSHKMVFLVIVRATLG